MSYLGIQIATICFSVFMIYFTYLSYRRKYFQTTAFIGWALVFVGLTIGSMFPKILEPFIEVLQIARLFDLYVIIGLLFLIVITFVNFLHVHKVNNKIDKLVQDQAINEDHSGKTS